MDALIKVVDPNQLTPDLEGTLQYDHATWIDLRCVSTRKVLFFEKIINLKLLTSSQNQNWEILFPFLQAFFLHNPD